ncbi:MAG: ATP-binding protein [Anaerolineaceae bacterium]|nr:ATP-binding protein [Anaerolineaceae bacterium]
MTAVKPETFKMAIQGGMLEALGINMYTSLGKCLVEFVANAYDSNAPGVEITIPFDDIGTGRVKLREEQKAKKKAEAESATGTQETVSQQLPITVQESAASPDAFKIPDGAKAQIALPDVSRFDETLPTEISIVIKDFGHGMSPADVATKFLPINRRRRLGSAGGETELKSEGGKRHVMGRKGLGKLAGFGTAQKITILTKRAGENFQTKFVLDAKQLLVAENLTEINIPATYIESANLEEHGTTITLQDLKPDAVKSNPEKIHETLAEAFFGIKAEEFSIKLNDQQVEESGAEYEFMFPEESFKSDGNLAIDYVNIPDVGTLELKYVVKFRKRGQHLSARKRGARIYCNGRLAAGPSLFKLGTGMHNFHAQDYMECIVIADDLDRLGIDFVNTNRTQLREDNDVVDSLLQHISDIMKVAMAKHSTFKDGQVDNEIKADKAGKMMIGIIDNLPRRSRGPATKLLKTIATRFGTESLEFGEMAPLVVQSMNASEVLIRLIELQTDAGTIAQIAAELNELGEIEKNDALKTYRGRKNGIIALRRLIEKGEELWNKKGIEGDLHKLLKEEPWLIKPEYSQYVTSDEDLNKLASKIAKTLGVDKFGKMVNEDGTTDKERPDLVFAMSDSSTPHVFTIVELKSPSIPLAFSHLTQLKKYITKVESFIKNELKQVATVNGYLIGAMPDIKATAEDQTLLLAEIAKYEATSDWKVIGLEQLLNRAQAIHSDIILSLEQELDEQVVSSSVPVIEINKAVIIQTAATAAPTNLNVALGAKEK